MAFAVALPWWGYVLALGAALAFAWLAYARVVVPLTPRQRVLLVSLRALTLLLIVVCLLRPVRFVPSTGARDSVVAILVDGSRSMRLSDADGPRIDRARTIAADYVQQIGSDFRTELLTFGESLTKVDVPQLAAEARRSDLSGALSSLVDRYRGQRLAGVVVISDGGDTAAEEAGRSRSLGVPVFTVGVGNATIARDREVIHFTAGEALLSDASIDLSVSAVSAGFGAAPIELRLTANGRPLEVRRVTPAADGTPIRQVFTVSPSADAPTVYSVEIPVGDGELVAENNVRRVLVPAQGRKRRVLLVEGAPGFEHTFLKRALAQDRSLEIDSVVRKGQNDEGRDTFFIQAGASRAVALASGYPTKRSDLFAYDAVIFGNISADFFGREQLDMTAAFVAERGGGLMVLGARSFERAGLVGTPLAEVLPLDLADRRSAVARTAATAPQPNALALTADGAAHPATRLAVSVDDSRKRWAQLPPLASVNAAGAPRPGAQVLAVTTTSGELQPVIAAQQYGLGRSIIFTGEASWRWRMLMPAKDTTYELVWRQLTRWLSSGAVDAIEIPPSSVTLPGTTDNVMIVVRDQEFKPISDAEVTLRVREPGGQERSLPAAIASAQEGRYAAPVRFDQAGVYTIAADVRRGSQLLGTITRPMLVGGYDVELSEPRLNEPVLQRIADSTGGRYIAAAEAASLPTLLRESGAGAPPMEMRDLWNTAWSLLAIILLLAAEWLTRRRVGLA